MNTENTKEIENKKSDSLLWTHYQLNNSQSLQQGHPRQDMLYKKINKIILRGKILEIGFGDGYLLNKLAKNQKYKCYGVDISEDNVEKMSRTISNVNFKVIDIDGKLPYEDDYFDGFIASEVLEHMSNKELKLCVKEIRRILKVDGIAILTFPAKENLTMNECFCPGCGQKFHKWGHKQQWDRQKTNHIFHNFKILSIKEFFVLFEGNNMVEKVLAFFVWSGRTILNKIIKSDHNMSSYLIVLKK